MKKTGRVLFFLLVLLHVTASTAIYPPADVRATPSLSDTPIGMPSFGLNTHLATRYPDAATIDQPASLLTELDVSWVREDFHFYRVRPGPEVWEWTFNDNAIRELIKRNINILGVIGGPSAPWATPYPGDTGEYASFYVPDTEAFVAFARGVVTRYRRYIKYWEIWNEPDNPHFWKPRPDARAYADVLMQTSAAIREVDPEATILIAGFNPYDSTFIREVLAAGTWNSFDIIAIHPYVEPFSPEESNLPSVIKNIRALTGQYGTKPVWATEVGWASGPSDNDPLGKTDRQQQANVLVRSLLLLWHSGVERSFWYTFKDDPGNPYGLIALGKGQADYSYRKPAFTAFQTLNRQLKGVSFVEQRNLFDQVVLVDFRTMKNQWLRPIQPNGAFEESGNGTARLTYNFSTKENDYVVFECKQPLPIKDNTFAIGVWIYGDGSGHGVQVWIRDAEHEVLQFRLGVVGIRGWKFISAPIINQVAAGNQIAGNGNGRVDFPAAFQAIVLDDIPDSSVMTGTIYLDDLTMISGREVYDLRFEKGDKSLDILWSPPGIKINLATNGEHGILIQRDGQRRTITAEEKRFSLTVTGSPVYLWHKR